MEILIYMLIVSLLLAFSFLAAFLWAAKNQQFDDLVTPAMRAIFEDRNEEREGENHAKQP